MSLLFLNELREVRKQNTGGFALYRLGTEDTAIWDALAVTPDFKFDLPTALAPGGIARGLTPSPTLEMVRS